MGKGWMGVPHVGGQCKHALIDVDAFCVPACELKRDKPVAEVANARGRMISPRTPLKFLPQLSEDLFHGSNGKRSAPVEDKERVRVGASHLPVAALGVLLQSPRGCGMQRHFTRFAALGVADMQQTLLKIDVRTPQRRGFTRSQPRRRDESEERGASHSAQTPGRRQSPCSLKQRADLLIGIDMGREAPAAFRTEKPDRRDLGGRIESQTIAGKAAHHRESMGGGEPAPVFACCGPPARHFRGQGATVAGVIRETCKAHESFCFDLRCEPRLTARGDEPLNFLDHRAGGVHASLPGHGIATSARECRSILL